MSDVSQGLPFDPDAFMQQEVDQPMATEVRLIPKKEYQATIDSFEAAKAFEVFDFTYKKGPRTGEQGSMTKFTVPFVLNDPQVAADLGRDTLKASAQIILDIDPATGGLDWGPDKNVELGRLRAAVNQNQPGQKWTPAMLMGAGPLMVYVDHEEIKGRSGAYKVARVTRFAKLSQ